MKKYILLALTLSSASYGAGFDCKLAKSIKEHTICDDLDLSDLDSDLNGKYKKYIEYAVETDRSDIKNNQISWLKSLAKECDEKASGLKSCLINSYSNRLKYMKEKYGYFNVDMEKNTDLSNFMRGRNELSIQFLPDYIPIGQKRFLIPIDWGQASQRVHGIYVADLNKASFDNVAEGYPNIDGIYKVKDSMILVLNSHIDFQGVGKNTISVLAIKAGEVKNKKIVEISYNATGVSNYDDCMSVENGGVAQLPHAGRIKNIHLLDVNKDGARDVVVEYGVRDCVSNTYSDYTSSYVVE